MNDITQAIFKGKYNHVKHDIEIYLDNRAQNTSDRYLPINPNAIVNLSINDTLADWVTTGTMTFFYNPETKTSTINSNTGNDSKATTGIRTPAGGSFSFRGDGYDLLRVKIAPSFDDISQGSNNNLLSVNKDRSFWTLSYLFSIYDMEDIDLPPGAQNMASSSIKCLKVQFWDYWYQKMLTNIIEYSTAYSTEADVEGDKQTKLYYNYGGIPTGTAINEIFKTVLHGDDIAPVTKVVADVNTEEWDQGAAKIFFTAPTDYSANDCVKYILDKHCSGGYAAQSLTAGNKNSSGKATINDFCILTKERGPLDTDIGYIALRPLTSLFEKAGKDEPGEYQFEHFFLQNYDGKNSPSKNYRAPLDKNPTSKKDIKTLKYNTITSYRFVDSSAWINSSQFVTSPVYSFDFSKRRYNIEFQDNSVLAARKFIAQNYIDNLYKKGSNSEDLFLLTLDKEKKDKNIRPMFSNYGDNPQIRQDGLQKLLRTGVFQNACINFRVLGLTFREPGRFIAIDKVQGVESGAFEDKFFGQYLVIDVKHIFESELYYNDITAVKIHRYDSLPSKFTDLIDS